MTLRSFALFLALAAIAAAQHPNFSGTWSLNLAESDFSDKRASAPDSLLLTVHQQGDDFRYDLLREKAGKKGRGHTDLVIGVPMEQSLGGTASAEWKGSSLEFKLIYNPGEATESEAVDTWSLSADGKKLISELITHLPNNGGDAHVRRVFDRKK